MAERRPPLGILGLQDRKAISHRHPQKAKRRFLRLKLKRCGEGWRRNVSGFTARSVRCDECLTDYLPQHTHRTKWGWVCGNCCMEPGRGTPMRYDTRSRLGRAYLRWRYLDDDRMLAALRLTVSSRCPPTGDGGIR